VKLILAQPSNLRFQWELEVLIANVRQFTDMPIVLLFSKPHDYKDTVPSYLASKYANVQCFVYSDNRFDKSYIPSIRPYLWWQYLKHDRSREDETYFYIDSDVIFKEWPDLSFVKPDGDIWYGSDCGNYLDYDYLRKVEQGEKIIKGMAQICHIAPSEMPGVKGIGAQMVIVKPTAEFWERSYTRSSIVWHYLDGVKSNIQKWTAEMWSQLWTVVEDGIITEAPKELDFCWSTDPLSRWDETKILHNSGVMEQGKLFFKGKYTDHVPFGENFDWVDKTKCSRKYVDAIEKVVV
jgi:hypothetical protein